MSAPPESSWFGGADIPVCRFAACWNRLSVLLVQPLHIDNGGLEVDRVGELDVYRRIRCVKMRGVNHNPGIFTLEVEDGVFRVTRVI